MTDLLVRPGSDGRLYTEPARRYRWDDFTEGNQAATKHGLYRAARAEEVADRVEAEAAQVAQRYPWTANYADERNRYARAVVDRIDGRAYVEQRIAGGVTAKGRERLYRLMNRLEEREKWSLNQLLGTGRRKRRQDKQ